MQAMVITFLLKMLFASPATYLGFILALVAPSMFKWKPNASLWLLALLLNFPSLQFLYLAGSHYGSWVDGNTNHLVDAPPMAVVDTLIIFFWGSGGAGLGLVLWLVLPGRFRAARPAQAIFSRDFWRARQPD
jgi:hypothetical protein